MMKVLRGLSAAISAAALLADPSLAQNKLGAHLTLDKLDNEGRAQLQWAKRLVGGGGYLKTLFMGIKPTDTGAPQHWKDFVNEIYRMDMIPVIRLAGEYSPPKGQWTKPQADPDGGYLKMAGVVKKIVSELPRSDKYPLYIEIWNEPNLDLEWSGKANLAEYARFFVACSKAIRSIGDSRIKILNGAFALSPEAVEQCVKADPEFINAFDVWASHPYPQNHPPEYNNHDGTAKEKGASIDGYALETGVLEKYGRKNVKVLITETGYGVGNALYEPEGFPAVNEYNRGDYMLRAYRDYYPKWPELIGVIPFLFADRNWKAFNWVDPDSKTLPGGVPSNPTYQYSMVRKLARPGESTASVSGKVVDSVYGSVIEGAAVSLANGSKTITDPMGNFIFSKLVPGTHPVTVSKDGFAPQKTTVAVNAGENGKADFKLQAVKLGKLAVSVQLSGERTYSHVTVTLNPGGKKASPDSLGNLVFADLIPTAYDLTAEGKGLTTHKLQGVVVNPAGTTAVALKIAADSSGGVYNELRNPSFEQVNDPKAARLMPAQWEMITPGSVEVARGISRTGLYSLAIPGQLTTAVCHRQITNYFTSKAGRRYTAGVWVRTSGLKPREDGGAWMTLTFTGNSGEVIQEHPGQVSIPGVAGAKVTMKLKGSEDWTYFEASGTAPESATRISVNLWCKAVSGTAYFDDAFLALKD